jgi:hypothetical protein
VFGQSDPHSFENQLNCCGERKVDDDDHHHHHTNKLHFNKCQTIGEISDNEQWYEHVPKLVQTHAIESTNANQQNIPQQKPHILIHDNEEGTCVLIDYAISGDENVTKEGAERTSLPLKMGAISCPETSVRNFYGMGVITQKSANLNYSAAET